MEDWRIALERKDLLSGEDPKTFWYNRLGAKLFCPFSHKFKETGQKEVPGFSYITAVDRECVRCGETDKTYR